MDQSINLGLETGRNSSLMNVSRASPESFKNGLFQVGHLTKCLFSSVIQSCPTLYDPIDCSMPGFPVHHQLPGLAQTRVHQVGDAIEPTQPRSSSSPPAFNLSSIRVFSNESVLSIGGQSTAASASVSVLPVNIQDWFPLGWTGWISLPSKGLSRVFSNTTVQKHQFFGAQLSL